MADVFLSYKRENKAAVQRLVQALRGEGLSVWWDQDIPPDAPWEGTIERELAAAKVVIVAWSKAAIASDNVKAEARRARTQGKLVQVFVEACEPPLFFGERQGVDLTGWFGDPGDARFDTVAAAAKAIRDGRPAPQGVGYAPPKRKSSPLLAIVATIIVLGMAGGGALLLRPPGLEDGAPVTTEQVAAAPAEPAAAASNSTAIPMAEPAEPKVELSVRHAMTAPSGHAIDFEAGTASSAMTEGSDFIVTREVTGDYAIAPAAPPAAVGVAWSGAPTPAACALDPARPSVTWSSPMPNDVGEYQCFLTREGRKGALILAPGSGPDGVRITYELWP